MWRARLRSLPESAVSLLGSGLEDWLAAELLDGLQRELVAPDQGQAGHDAERRDHCSDPERGRESVDECVRNRGAGRDRVVGARVGDRRLSSSRLLGV
jgi:hypothetical protein